MSMNATAPSGPMIGDAFGQLLLSASAHDGLPDIAYETTERDDGLLTVRDACYYFTPVLPDDPHGRLLADVSGRVLDIGCGAGRHLLHLKHRGVAALGIDTSPGAVQVCGHRGADAICGDIRRPPALGTFDTLLLLGGNLGLLGTPGDARALLIGLAQLANPSARLIAEGFDATATSDPAHITYQTGNLESGRHRGQVTVRVRYRGLATAWLDLWFPPAEDLPAVVSGTGWTLTTVEPAGEGSGYHVVLSRSTP
ncbi:class I SAM-dependent methyltransferase [Hamadaea sp. NPDC050747]|uniref:class I SAM-dependent methyltransferase n=1 Tax=Hamadaea sp. NPDC050747 TaxID=3155789 RepID=UPI0033FE175C